MSRPIKTACCVCRNYRDGRVWYSPALEEKALVESSYDVSHGYCPPCLVAEYKDLFSAEEINKMLEGMV